MNEAQTEQLRFLRSAAAVRLTCRRVFDRVSEGHSSWWQLDLQALDQALQATLDVTQKRYPSGSIPYHSRWRHFEPGGIDRTHWLNDSALPPAERAGLRIDLAVISVLLDAGAGPDWQFHEVGTGLRFGRSEGLGIASLHGFMQGLFSSDAEQPFRVDARALTRLNLTDLARMFQCSETNPLIGLQGRLDLLHRLGSALAARPDLFGSQARPGGLLQALGKQGRQIAASSILALLLEGFGEIWPSDQRLGGVALGDCWPYPGIEGGWVAFHKLSQWLSYSLLEPLQSAGYTITGLDDLTGLPEYRNGGLFLDTGVILAKHPGTLEATWKVSDPCIVEWRALTVVLIDLLAEKMRTHYPEPLSLASVLEGGTWAAGRVLAQKRQGRPPLNIDSDGTVF